MGLLLKPASRGTTAHPERGRWPERAEWRAPDARKYISGSASGQCAWTSHRPPRGPGRRAGLPGRASPTEAARSPAGIRGHPDSPSSMWMLYYDRASGEVAERIKALVSKTSMGAISSWVRIPPSPWQLRSPMPAGPQGRSGSFAPGLVSSDTLYENTATYTPERCQSGRMGATGNRVSRLRGTMGSNPILSATRCVQPLG